MKLTQTKKVIIPFEPLTALMNDIETTIYFSGEGYYSPRNVALFLSEKPRLSHPKENNGKIVFRRVADEFGSDIPDNALYVVSMATCYEKFDHVFEVLF